MTHFFVAKPGQFREKLSTTATDFVEGGDIPKALKYAQIFPDLLGGKTARQRRERKAEFHGKRLQVSRLRYSRWLWLCRRCVVVKKLLSRLGKKLLLPPSISQERKRKGGIKAQFYKSFGEGNRRWF